VPGCRQARKKMFMAMRKGEGGRDQVCLRMMAPQPYVSYHITLITEPAYVYLEQAKVNLRVCLFCMNRLMRRLSA
jgi:hypothetical protein